MPEQKSPFFKSSTWITIMFLAGVIFLAVGLFQMILMPVSAGGNYAAAYISAGTVMLIFAGLRLYRGEKDYLQDERTRKIGAYGLSWSWFLTFIALFVIFWSYYLHIWSPDAGTLCVLLILFMGISAAAFRWWLFRKGDLA
jgi:peptidoglycan/LPS O-acetylase OafA/YrhL